MIRNASSDDYDDNSTKTTNIKGLIFISDQEITSENKYNPPELIAIAAKNKTSILGKFSFDKTGGNSSEAGSYIAIATMKHTFVERCEVI